MTATRDSIERTLRTMHEAENSRELTPAEKVAATDLLMAPGARGWTNGVARGGRAEEREYEELLFTAVPDYQRDFEQVLIDSPRAAVAWKMTGTAADTGAEFDLVGASVFRFDDDGRIEEFWLFFHEPLAEAAVPE